MPDPDDLAAGAAVNISAAQAQPSGSSSDASATGPAAFAPAEAVGDEGTWADLPDEIYSIIASHCNERACRPLRQTCRRLCAVVDGGVVRLTVRPCAVVEQRTLARWRAAEDVGAYTASERTLLLPQRACGVPLDSQPAASDQAAEGTAAATAPGQQQHRGAGASLSSISGPAAGVVSGDAPDPATLPSGAAGELDTSNGAGGGAAAAAAASPTACAAATPLLDAFSKWPRLSAVVLQVRAANAADSTCDLAALLLLEGGRSGRMAEARRCVGLLDAALARANPHVNAALKLRGRVARALLAMGHPDPPDAMLSALSTSALHYDAAQVWLFVHGEAPLPPVVFEGSARWPTSQREAEQMHPAFPCGPLLPALHALGERRLAAAAGAVVGVARSHAGAVPWRGCARAILEALERSLTELGAGREDDASASDAADAANVGTVGNAIEDESPLARRRAVELLSAQLGDGLAGTAAPAQPEGLSASSATALAAVLPDLLQGCPQRAEDLLATPALCADGAALLWRCLVVRDGVDGTWAHVMTLPAAPLERLTACARRIHQLRVRRTALTTCGKLMVNAGLQPQQLRQALGLDPEPVSPASTGSGLAGEGLAPVGAPDPTVLRSRSHSLRVRKARAHNALLEYGIPEQPDMTHTTSAAAAPGEEDGGGGCSAASIWRSLLHHALHLLGQHRVVGLPIGALTPATADVVVPCPQPQALRYVEAMVEGARFDAAEDCAWAWALLSALYAATGDAQQACRWLQRVADTEPPDGSVPAYAAWGLATGCLAGQEAVVAQMLRMPMLQAHFARSVAAAADAPPQPQPALRRMLGSADGSAPASGSLPRAAAASAPASSAAELPPQPLPLPPPPLIPLGALPAMADHVSMWVACAACGGHTQLAEQLADEALSAWWADGQSGRRAVRLLRRAQQRGDAEQDRDPWDNFGFKLLHELLIKCRGRGVMAARTACLRMACHVLRAVLSSPFGLAPAAASDSDEGSGAAPRLRRLHTMSASATDSDHDNGVAGQGGPSEAAGGVAVAADDGGGAGRTHAHGLCLLLDYMVALAEYIDAPQMCPVHLHLQVLRLDDLPLLALGLCQHGEQGVQGQGLQWVWPLAEGVPLGGDRAPDGGSAAEQLMAVLLGDMVGRCFSGAWRDRSLPPGLPLFDDIGSVLRAMAGEAVSSLEEAQRRGSAPPSGLGLLRAVCAYSRRCLAEAAAMRAGDEEQAQMARYAEDGLKRSLAKVRGRLARFGGVGAVGELVQLLAEGGMQEEADALLASMQEAQQQAAAAPAAGWAAWEQGGGACIVS